MLGRKAIQDEIGCLGNLSTQGYGGAEEKKIMSGTGICGDRKSLMDFSHKYEKQNL